MSIGEKFALVCTQNIVKKDQDRVLTELKKLGKEIIEISLR